MAINQDITQFPPAPNSSTDTPEQFNAKADAFVDHQSDTYVTEVNTWANEANSTATTVNSDASNASTSASNASTSAGEASTSAGEALTSANNASTSAGEASTSASNANTSAINASASEGNALASANAAATSEGNASTSETNAAASAVDASDSAQEASDLITGKSWLTETNTFSAGQRGHIVTIGYNTTINPDLATSNRFECTLTGDVTVGLPTNIVSGQGGMIYLAQDAVGSHTITFDSMFIPMGDITPVTDPNTINIYVFEVYDASKILITRLGEM